MELFLKQSDWALPENKSGFCHVHRARCPINPGWVIHMQSRNKTATEIAAALDPPCTEVPSTSWWARCNEVVGTGTDPDEVASPPPLVMNITGLGQLLGCATAKAGCDVSLELLGWLKQRAQFAAKCQEDLFIAYLPEKFPPPEVQGHVSDARGSGSENDSRQDGISNQIRIHTGGGDCEAFAGVAWT